MWQGAEARRTLTEYAAREGRLTALEAILGPNPHVGVLRGRALHPRGDTLLASAAAEGHTAVVERLLALGAEVDLTCRWSFTPLQGAGQQGRADTVRVLCAAGATLRGLPDHGQRLPHYVRCYDAMWDVSSFASTLEALLEAGGDPKSHGAEAGLCCACKYNGLDVVKMLIRAMGEWTQVNRGGTALGVAARHSRLDIVIELLMARGSDDDATWHDMVQRAIARARRRRKHACLLTLEASTHESERPGVTLWYVCSKTMCVLCFSFLTAVASGRPVRVAQGEDYP
jgi:hypothetical protein